MWADRGSKRTFDEPIDLPRGRRLVTLQDAGNYSPSFRKPSTWRPSGRMRCRY
jgi:hypothetical protein